VPHLVARAGLPAYLFSLGKTGSLVMYAVIRTGGKQYRVAKNDIISVERLAGAPGEILELNDVLMLGDGGNVTVGAPLVTGACVGAAVVEQAKGDKILIFKKKRRHNYRRKNGHRQDLTVLRITEILTDGKKPDKTPIAIEATTEKKAGEKKAGAKKAAAGKKPAAKAAAPKAAKKSDAKSGTAKKPAAKKAAKKKEE
jgi:large subunit ribosomal protein L21